MCVNTLSTLFVFCWFHPEIALISRDLDGSFWHGMVTMMVQAGPSDDFGFASTRLDWCSCTRLSLASPFPRAMRCVQAYFAASPTACFLPCSSCTATTSGNRRHGHASSRAEEEDVHWLVLADENGRAMLLCDDQSISGKQKWRLERCVVMHSRHLRLEQEGDEVGEANRAWDACVKHCQLHHSPARTNVVKWENEDSLDAKQLSDRKDGTSKLGIQDKPGTESNRCIAYSTSKRHKLVLQSTRWTLYCQDCWVKLPHGKLESREKGIHYRILAFENMRNARGTHWEGACIIAENLKHHTCTVRVALYERHGKVNVLQARYDMNAHPEAHKVQLRKASASLPRTLQLQSVEASFVAPVDMNTFAQVVDSPDAAVGQRDNWLQFWHIEETEKEGLALLPREALEFGPDVGRMENLEGIGSTCVLAAGGDSFCPSVMAVGYTDGSIVLQQMLGDGTSCHRLHSTPITCLGEVFLQKGANLNCDQEARTFLASGASDGTMALLDLEEESVIAQWTPFASRVAAIYTPPLPSPNDSQSWLQSCFAAVDSKGAVCIYNIASRRSLHILVGLPSQPTDIAWDVAHAYLFCLCKNSKADHHAKPSCTVYVWDILSGKLERTLTGSAAIDLYGELKKDKDGSTLPRGILPQVNHLATASSYSGGGAEDSLSGQYMPIRAVSVLQNAAILDVNVRTLLAKALPSVCSSVGALFRVSSKGQGTEEARRFERNRALTAMRLALATLHFWGVNTNLDEILQVELAVHPLSSILPVFNSVTASLEDGTLMFEMGKSTTQDPSSSARVLAVLAITNLLIEEAPNAQNACVALTTFYGLQIWEQFESMVVSDLSLFATHWQDPSQPVRDAAHMLMGSSIRQLSKETLEDILGFDESGLLQQPSHQEEIFSTRVLTACAACAAAPDHINKMAPNLAPCVVPHLAKMVLQAPAPYSAAAASILVDGLKCNWGELLSMDLAAFMKEVLVLYDVVSITDGGSRGPRRRTDMPATGSGTFWQATEYTAGAIAALGQTLKHPSPSESTEVKGFNASTELMHCRAALSRLLPALAAADPLLFFTIVVQRMVVLAPNSTAHIHGLMTAVQLVQQYPAVAMTALPQLRSLLMLAISPLVPQRRATCLQASTALVKELAEHLPCVDYLPDSMLFAVSVSEQLPSGAPLVEIYDLHSAMKRYVLLDEESKNPIHIHACKISAVSLDPTGLRAAAFILESLCILIWDLQVPWHARITNKPAELRPHCCCKSTTGRHPAPLSGITPATLHKLTMGWSGSSQVDVSYCNNLMLSFAV